MDRNAAIHPISRRAVLRVGRGVGAERTSRVAIVTAPVWSPVLNLTLKKTAVSAPNPMAMNSSLRKGASPSRWRVTTTIENIITTHAAASGSHSISSRRSHARTMRR